ncbi:hypothetical protein ANCCEY_01122 [Ancylostoma ceylanicum]|uniref:Uncharacterized protein n=1 Tax=Ancylostoma ceylanicum TaxID=53326 RepID=A0A0D6M8C5_9BILA|nr:hypothetical protein ANCCEY_01122 [Ancylostoma ceylanicum]
MEPVGTPGTHAGLPKTLREIVDKSFYEDWPNATRQEKLEEEVRRLGLPHNPRLGRQVDNRIAYLRRVKNLNEMKKIQDQVRKMAQLMALMMAGAAQPPVEEPSGEEQQTATSSVVPSFPMPPSLPPLMNPFLHGSTSMPSLFPSVGAPVDNAVAAGDAESVDMDDDDDCTTEDGRLQIDPDQ